MGKIIIIGILYLCLGAILILIPWYILPVCGLAGKYSCEEYHRCHATLKAESVVGIITILAGIVLAILPGYKIKRNISQLILLISGLVILFPLAITKVCTIPNHPCLIGTRPGLVIFGAVMAIISAICIFRPRPPRPRRIEE